MTAFTGNDPAKFKSAGDQLASELQTLAGAQYPSLHTLELETQYNAFKPFRKAWIWLLLAGILFAISTGMKSSIPYAIAWLALIVGFILHTYGLYLRVAIAGRPPVSNMYESVNYMGWGVVLFAAIFELIYRQRIFALCGTIMGVIVLILADMLPFDSGISPLVPVLRSNYWLIIHVLTIVISYSAFALAMMLAHFALGFYLFAPQKTETLRSTNTFIYRSLQVGVLLLAAGTILGGVWANESWGRFWGWDPKETWALISLLGYLAILHARLVGLIGPFGLAICSIVGFQLILMTWYGVNFILASGLHSYGFGSGGTEYIIGYLGIEALFMAVVAVRYRTVRPELRHILEQEDPEISEESEDSPLVP